MPPLNCSAGPWSATASWLTGRTGRRRVRPSISTPSLARLHAHPAARYARRAGPVAAGSGGGTDQSQSHSHRPLSTHRRAAGAAAGHHRRGTHHRGHLPRAGRSEPRARLLPAALAMGSGRVRYFARVGHVDTVPHSVWPDTGVQHLRQNQRLGTVVTSGMRQVGFCCVTPRRNAIRTSFHTASKNFA